MDLLFIGGITTTNGSLFNFSSAGEDLGLFRYCVIALFRGMRLEIGIGCWVLGDGSFRFEHWNLTSRRKEDLEFEFCHLGIGLFRYFEGSGMKTEFGAQTIRL